MIAFIVLGLLSISVFKKMYKSRDILKSLSKKEWLQCIVSYSVAFAAIAIIFSFSSKLMDSVQVGWLRSILHNIINLIGLVFVGFMMQKLSPEKLR